MLLTSACPFNPHGHALLPGQFRALLLHSFPQTSELALHVHAGHARHAAKSVVSQRSKWDMECLISWPPLDTLQTNSGRLGSYNEGCINVSIYSIEHTLQANRLLAGRLSIGSEWRTATYACFPVLFSKDGRVKIWYVSQTVSMSVSAHCAAMNLWQQDHNLPCGRSR